MGSKVLEVEGTGCCRDANVGEDAEIMEWEDRSYLYFLLSVLSFCHYLVQKTYTWTHLLKIRTQWRGEETIQNQGHNLEKITPTL